MPNPEEYLASLLTTPEQEAKNLRASQSKRRVLAFADALRHIGNIYTTTQGAPAMQFNDPTTMERTRYQQDKLLRDANNMKYYTYQQQKAAQDARQRQWEATFNYNIAKDAANAQALKDYRDATLGLRRDTAERTHALNVQKHNDTMALNREKFGETIRHNKRQEGIAASNAGANWYRAKNGGKGGRSGNEYVFPTKTGFITLGRDLNTNAIGKKALYGELKSAGYLSEQDVANLGSPWVTSEQKSAILNTGISQWLMNDPNAVSYMKTHFGAKDTSDPYAEYLDADDDEEDDYSEYMEN